jgi:hypothetical protein
MAILDDIETYIIEGFVESDPLTGYCTIRTEDESGTQINFDPQSGLKTFCGREVRLVLVPLATVAQLQRLEREAQENGSPVEIIDDPSEQN